MSFIDRPKPEPTKLDREIDRVVEFLGTKDPASEEYANATDMLTKLKTLQGLNARPRVSPDTVLVVLGNLAGIVAILGYERFNVVVSKALPFVIKPR